MASAVVAKEVRSAISLDEYVPEELRSLPDIQRDLPRIAKNPRIISTIEDALQSVPTHHDVYRADAREMPFLKPESVHLVVTSPPYWTLKEYQRSDGQMGWIADYEEFLSELNKVWVRCYDALVPGGRLVCVVGDVCLSRRRNQGRHTVVPLHASIQEQCRAIGFDNLAPIIWNKIANAVYEVENGNGGFLGKPYEPNAIIKNDIEYILMQRKPGGYRTVSSAARILSLISEENHRRWFQQIWGDVTGASTRNHPAPYPIELAIRLVRMFSFAGDTVLDPFLGTGTTQLAAAQWGRNSVGSEIEPQYMDMAVARLMAAKKDLFRSMEVSVHAPRRSAAKSRRT